MDERGVGVQLCEHSGLIKNIKRDCGYHRESEVLIVCVCWCAFEKLLFFFLSGKNCREIAQLNVVS